MHKCMHSLTQVLQLVQLLPKAPKCVRISRAKYSFTKGDDEMVYMAAQGERSKSVKVCVCVRARVHFPYDACCSWLASYIRQLANWRAPDAQRTSQERQWWVVADTEDLTPAMTLHDLMCSPQPSCLPSTTAQIDPLRRRRLLSIPKDRQSRSTRALLSLSAYVLRR